MRALVAALLVPWLAAAVIGTAVPGLFWLTLAAMAGLLVTGAAGVSLVLRPAEQAVSPAEPMGELRLLRPTVCLPHSRPAKEQLRPAA